VVCGRCKQDLTVRAETAAAHASSAVETELPQPPSVEETYLAGVSGPTVGPPLEYVSPGDEIGDATVAAIPEPDVSAVETLDRLISEALAMRATDIHIEADAHKTRVRFRVDGHLREVHSLPKSVRAPLVSRLKVLSRLDIVERRLPQDGSFRVRRGADEIDVRLSTLPSFEGESAALRLLSHTVRLRALGELGLEKDDHDRLLNSIYRPEGLILVTGPTGSGKTTTLYAVLALLSSIERKIITLEDPIEYRLGMISQTAVNPDIGFDFARGLRHVLRHDPDIILVGEIRDRETAEIAVQASLTGHLLFSTLHTAGTAEAIVRLLELGIESYYVREVLEAVLAQRLVRVLCPACREPYQPEPALMEQLRVPEKECDGATWYRPRGCKKCQGIGYRGRVGVFELLSSTPDVRDLVLERASSREMYKAARAAGMPSLWRNALRKVQAGTTSVEEVRRMIPEPEVP